MSTSHSAVSSRTELLTAISGVIGNKGSTHLKWIANSIDLREFVYLFLGFEDIAQNLKVPVLG